MLYQSIPHISECSAFACARCLIWTEVVSRVLYTSEQLLRKKMPLCVALLFTISNVFHGPLVILLVWYILKQLFTSVSVNVGHIYPAIHFATLLNNY